jgi:hypothetical protein
MGACPEDPGGDGGDNNGGQGKATPQELQGVLGAMCDFIERCPDALYPIGYRDRGECIDILYWLFSCRIVDVGGDRTEPRRFDISLSEDERNQCAAYFAGLSCEDVACIAGDGECDNGGEVCSGLASSFSVNDDNSDSDGAAGPGQECRYGYDTSCRDGYYCRQGQYDESAQAMGCSVCLARAGVGESCVDWTGGDQPPCDEGLFCLPQDEANADYRCVAPQPVGAECTDGLHCQSGFCQSPSFTCSDGGNLGDACEPPEPWGAACRQGLYCEANVCAARKVPGSPCVENVECENGYCDSDNGICGLADGSPCQDYRSYECQSQYCESATETCQPSKGLGEGCSENNECGAHVCANYTCAVGCNLDSECESGQYCDWDSWPSSCQTLRENGQSCYDDESCASGYCTFDDVCASRPQLGDSCSGWGDCPPGTYCDDGSCAPRLGPDADCSGYDSCLEPYLCLSGTCTLISLSCELAPAGEPCAYLQFCESDAFCDATRDFTCRRRYPVGAPCNRDEECQGDGHCAYDEARGEMLCQARPGLNEVCEPYGTPCVEGAACVGGTCQESSDTFCYEHTDCAGTEFCSWETERCQPRRGEGDPCDTYDAPCDANSYCDWSTDICMPRPGAGGPCDSDTGCLAGSYCSDSGSGICLDRAGEGGACDNNPTDYSDPHGTCLEDFICESLICTSRKDFGEYCSEDSECAGNLCSEGVCVAQAQCVMP